MAKSVPLNLLDIIESKRFGVEYEPIVGCRSREIFGYEALSRFYDQGGNSVRPDVVYASLHTSPLTLFQVEYENKKIQLSEAPESVHLFTNVDQDSYFAGESSVDDNRFITLLERHKKNRITIELIENSDLVDAQKSLVMIERFSDKQILTALDDLFAPQTMFSFEVVQLVDFIKLDKWIIQSQQNRQLVFLVKSLIQFANSFGKKTILEGIETEEDARFAQFLGVDFIQGFLFRDRFIQKRA